MAFGRLKIDKADKVFSLFIRTRDNWTCQRCQKYYAPPTMSLQCSHYFGRTKETVRFDEENCIALCFGCHRIWEKEDREEYRRFMIKKLGQKKFDLLEVRAYMIGKKDRKMAYLYWNQRLKDLEKREEVRL